jgi:ribose-phosphate pyrophosphokinase
MVFSTTVPLPSTLPKTSGSDRLYLISGSAHVALAQDIANYLGVNLIPTVRKQFADGEIYTQIQDSIRGGDVYLIQPTCKPVNDCLMELMIMVDACRRASARQITAVLPYYGYARADRKTAGREAITAKLVANIIAEAGTDRVISVDLHSAQVQGFFDIPLDHIYGSPVLQDYIRNKNLSNVVVVSPDIGGVARARAFAKKLNDAPLAIVDKRRQAHNCAEVMNIIGDVYGKTAILVDDMIDTAGTITEAAKFLRKQGAQKVYACATHAVFSPPAIERLSSGCLEEVIVTNTIPISEEKHFPQLTVISIANFLGEAIFRIHRESSISSMFN